MPKRFIICCDGTWQSSDSGRAEVPSNVAILSRIIAADDVDEDGEVLFDQVSYYMSGIGTDSDGDKNPIVWAANQTNKAVQGAFGIGLRKNVIRAYHFLATNYRAGDEICLFGFSRGAYTARVLGWCLTEFGLLKPKDMDDFNWWYQHLRDSNTPARTKPTWEEWIGEKKEETTDTVLFDHINPTDAQGNPLPRRGVPTLVKIKVIGVWDTVGALGLPDSWYKRARSWVVKDGGEFLDTSLNDRVEHAFQALALDEHRGAFTPTLWYLDSVDEKKKPSCDLRQCWFPGYHCDIGGGCTNQPNTETENHRFIDQMSLAWMCDQIDGEGLIKFDKEAADRYMPRLNEKKVESKNAEVETVGAANFSASITADPISFMYSMDIGGSSIPRKPGCYPNGHTDYNTQERMHPSIQLLIENGLKGETWSKNPAYCPTGKNKALHGWEFDGTPENDMKGKGARWKKLPVPEKAGFFSTSPAQLGFDIQEHIIREAKGKMNFEARLLPQKTLHMLMKRNQRMPKEARYDISPCRD